MQTPSPHPLHGLRILDFTRVLAGPYCTALMADMGADVIKIESAEGDDYRHIGPFRDGESLLFQSVNRGKRSVVADLKSPADLARIKALVPTADVVIENFRPGVMARLGLGYDALAALNPSLVYVSLSGFGQTGPEAQRPAYDMIAQALSGIMAATGEPDGPPTMIGEAIGDVAGGLFGAWAMMVALYDRQRTGRGRHVDVALFDSLLALMPSVACRTVTAGGDPTRTGNRHALSAPFGVYAAKGGHFAVAVLNDRLFSAFAAVIGHPGLPADPRFASDAARRANEPALAGLIEGWAASLAPGEAVALLSAAGIPASEIATPRQAWLSDQARARQMATEVEHPTLGPLSIWEQPAHFSGLPRGGRRPAPALDEHRNEIFPEDRT